MKRSCLLLLLLLLMTANAHAAEKRIALPIGNNDYSTDVGPLRNPGNDVNLIADVLRTIGFDNSDIRIIRNANRVGFLQAVGVFPEKLKPGDTFRDCSDCPEMIVVPAGSFMMGSPKSEKGRSDDEGPQRRVTISKPLAVGKFEVTRRQFDAFVKATGHAVGDSCWTFEGEKWNERKGRSYRNPGFSQGGDHPVVCVHWHDAKAYVKWLNGKVDGAPYRLLSESEWEYVARAGTTTLYFFGSDESALCANGNGADKGTSLIWKNNSCSDGYKRTAPVGTFSKNDFGLYDVLGNAWEWGEDCWHENYRNGPTDGSAWLKANDGDCTKRVLRGGSWFITPLVLRSAVRVRLGAEFRNVDVGFRIARTFD